MFLGKYYINFLTCKRVNDIMYFMEVIFIKNIAFQVEDDFHIEIKVKATKEGKTIKDYIMELIRKDLDKK